MKKDRLTYIILLLFLVSFASFAQIRLEGKVIDKKTKLPIAFAHVFVNHSTFGTLTNEDGIFQLDCAKMDSVVISYIGYETVKVQGNKSSLQLIELVEEVQFIDHVTITGNSDFLYKLISEAKLNLKKNSKQKMSKAYMFVYSMSDNEPLEHSEAFYNAMYRNGGVEQLQFKNGRATLAQNSNHRYFVNLDLSQALSQYSLLNSSRDFPKNPLQISKRRMKRVYSLSTVYRLNDIIKILFIPKKSDSDYFAGTITLNKRTNAILEIEIHDIDKEEAVFEGIGDTNIDSILYNMKYSFFESDNKHVLSNIQLHYTAHVSNAENMQYQVETDCVLHLYDYEKAFFTPIFNYPVIISDYRLFTLPPDSLIWKVLKKQNHIKLTSYQINQVNQIQNIGLDFSTLFNTENSFFENNYAHWDSTKRQLIRKLIPTIDKNKLVKVGDLSASGVLLDKLKIQTQIYCDVVDTDKGFVFETAAVLDVYESFNYLEDSDPLYCYINIYFDLAEIYRRRLQVRLFEEGRSLDEIKMLYQQTLNELQEVQLKFQRDAFAGRDLEKMMYWNTFVKQELGIDNMNLFKLDTL